VQERLPHHDRYVSGDDERRVYPKLLKLCDGTKSLHLINRRLITPVHGKQLQTSFRQLVRVVLDRGVEIVKVVSSPHHKLLDRIWFIVLHSFGELRKCFAMKNPFPPFAP